jgi:hypothetical protein
MPKKKKLDDDGDDDFEIVFTPWGAEPQEEDSGTNEPDVSYNMVILDVAEEVNKKRGKKNGN